MFVCLGGWGAPRVVRHESFRLDGYTPKYAEQARSRDGLVALLGPMGRFLVVEDHRYDGVSLSAIDGVGCGPTTWSNSSRMETALRREAAP